MSSQQQQKQRNGGSNNGGGRTSGGPAPFLMKTHQMVEDEGTNEVISWGENGTTFVVWKPLEFARDLLPVHFKHSNFSSFVRQLNTYGFRKVVADRWEFANDNFQRGKRSLLCEIRRRKAPPNPSSANKSNNNNNNNAKNMTTTPTSTSTSLDVHSSSSTSSPPPPPPPPSQEFLDLSNENEKLKKDNQILSNELTLAKQQCQHLLSFLPKHVSMNDINVSLLMKEAALVGVEIERGETKKVEKEEAPYIEVKEEGKNNVACLKLFGVLLKGFEGEKSVTTTNGGRKRGRCEEGSSSGRPVRVCFGGGAPWMGMTSPVRESSKVCN